MHTHPHEGALRSGEVISYMIIMNIFYDDGYYHIMNIDTRMCIYIYIYTGVCMYIYIYIHV